MLSADLRRRFNLSLFVWGVLIAALAILVALPLKTMNVAPELLAVQEGVKAVTVFLIPYAAVGALGAAVGLSEVSSTFSDYPREAIVTRWGQYLIGLNALAAMVAYLLARIYAPPDTDPTVLIVAVGVGFPALIRTKFTLAKNFGGGNGEGDVSVNLGWLYDQFQYLCKKQIDLELMTYRRAKVDQLLKRYSTVQELYDTALYALKARATLTPEEETAKRAELERIIGDKLPPELTRLDLGLLILELGGVAFVDSMTLARETIGAAGGHEALTLDRVVKELRALPLAELTQKAIDACSAPDDKDKIRQLAEPVPGIPELTQKASIARYLADKLGLEAAHNLA
jgi:hypothetical protein